MNVAYQQLVQHFDQREMIYIADADNQSVSTDIVGEVGDYRVVVHVPDESDLVQVSGRAPIRVPAGARRDIAELIARSNHKLRIGKLTLDFDTGELLFRITQIITDAGLEDDVVDWMICTTLAVMDLYLPAALSVIYGGETPEDAVRRVTGAGPGTSAES